MTASHEDAAVDFLLSAGNRTSTAAQNYDFRAAHVHATLAVVEELRRLRQLLQERP